MVSIEILNKIESDEKNEWGDAENELLELDNRTALSHENDIIAALLKARMPQEVERGLMEYYDEDDSINRMSSPMSLQ